MLCIAQFLSNVRVWMWSCWCRTGSECLFLRTW